MPDYQLGELIDITIQGARVLEQDTTVEGFPFLVAIHGDINSKVEIFLHDAVTIERVAPAEWPPHPGDLWRDRAGHLWLGASYCPDLGDGEDSKGIDDSGTRTVLVCQYSDATCRPGARHLRPENVIQMHGPMLLVRREGPGRRWL